MSLRQSPVFRSFRGLLSLFLGLLGLVSLPACRAPGRSERQVRMFQVEFTATWSWDTTARTLMLEVTRSMPVSSITFSADSYPGGNYGRPSETEDTANPVIGYRLAGNTYQLSPIAYAAGAKYVWLHIVAGVNGQTDYLRYEWQIPAPYDGEPARIYRHYN